MESIYVEDDEVEGAGPGQNLRIRLRNVEEAQQNIVAVVRRLEDSGEVVISGRGGGEDEIIV